MSCCCRQVERDAILSGRVVFMLVAPLCETWSEARYLREVDD